MSVLEILAISVISVPSGAIGAYLMNKLLGRFGYEVWGRK